MKLISNQTVPLIVKLTSTLVVAGGLLLSGHASAASQCKGLENSACDAQASCSWVQGYERKDGKKVNAFCRTKAKRLAKKATKSDTGQIN